MQIRIPAALLPMACVIAMAGQAAAEGKKYALVIGVESYDPTQLTRLRFAEDDALALGEELESLGFDVIVMTSQSDIPQRKPVHAEDILRQLDRRLVDRDPEDTLVVSFSGHGVHLVDDETDENGAKETYFCPERADLGNRTTLVSLSVVMQKMADCQAGRKLLLVDSCREEVQPRDVTERAAEVEIDPAGVIRRTVPRGMLVLFSCGPGERSLEVAELGENGHGIFTFYVIKYLRGHADSNRYPMQTLSVTELAAYVTRETRDYVDRRFNKDQRPELVSRTGISDWGLGESRRRQPTISIGMQMVLIPDGEFLMGATRNERTRGESEVPQHRVRITRPFYMGKYEVTQAEWDIVMERNPSAFSSSGSNSDLITGMNTSRFPVEQVTWYDAVEFCNKLSDREGLSQYYSMMGIQQTDGSISGATVTVMGGNGFRLPTEAEWEYACRAGTSSPFHYGSSINGFDANVGEPYGGGFQTGPQLMRSTTVGSYEANDFGLYDMHGNVYEMCFDCFDAATYKNRLRISSDPVVTTAEKDLRVMRGGCWGLAAHVSRSANRVTWPPGARNRIVGFRIARSQ